MKEYIIKLHGCDDNNEILVWLKEDEKKLLDALAEQFEKSAHGHGCKPTIELSEKIN